MMEHQIESEISDKNNKEDDEKSIQEDRLRSSSSVSSISDIESAITDFSCEDSSQIDRNENGSLSIDREQCDGPDQTHLGDASALKSPPAQVMERPADTSDYRIPSYVFATSKPNNQEWSTTSNESLFSIYTGNMSFTRDQFSWLLDPELLGAYGPGDIRKSGELPPPSPRQVKKSEHKTVDIHKEEQMPTTSQETLKSGEEIIAAHFKTLPVTPPPYQGKNTARVDEATYLGFGMMKKDDLAWETKGKISSASDDIHLSNSCISHHSDASGQSFAFPVLAEIGRDKSVNSGHSHVRANQRKNSVVVTDQEATKSPKSPKSAKATTEVAPTYCSWFYSCFSCCSCC
ncbi:hypothetical protein BVRB_5g123600 [Beta vulgaris subsp. vulgaris]|nr:hypothetical protein BVRB_5g123600 [Beta vulgaris subsp. vulgaris]